MEQEKTGLRLVIVNSRYWPLVGEQERSLANLAIELQSLGAQPTILSARWASNWPSQVTHRGMQVVRLSPAPRGGWSTYRYVREMSRWVRRRAPQIDLVYVGGMRHEAYGAVAAVRGRACPVVLRPLVAGIDGDCRWQSDTRIGRRIRRRCQDADAIIVSSESSESELIDAGYTGNKIVRIVPGARLPQPRTASSRGEARLALGGINHDLAAAESTPVAVCVERLTKNRGISELIIAWKSVVERLADAQLWIVGDGPQRKEFFEQIVDLGLHQQVLLPGSFDDLDEVYRAADVCVVPAPESHGTTFAAMASGLPVVTIATSDSRAMMDSGVHGLLVPAGDEGALSAAISQLLEIPALGARLGAAARRRVEDQHSLTTAAERHLELFTQLVGTRQRGSG